MEGGATVTKQTHLYTLLLEALQGQLTGDVPADRNLLVAAVKTHVDEPWGGEFAKAIFRLMWDSNLISEDEKKSFNEAKEADEERLEAMRTRAWDCIREGRLDEAESLASRLLEVASKLRKPDAETMYMEVDHPVELAYALETTKASIKPFPPRKVPALLLMAEIKRARKQFDEALSFLDRAIQCSPLSLLPRFLRLNLLKSMGQVERAFEEGLPLHALCWTKVDLASYYRHLGWCASDFKRWDLALCLQLASLHYQVHSMAFNEISTS